MAQDHKKKKNMEKYESFVSEARYEPEPDWDKFSDLETEEQGDLPEFASHRREIGRASCRERV